MALDKNKRIIIYIVIVIIGFISYSYYYVSKNRQALKTNNPHGQEVNMPETEVEVVISADLISQIRRAGGAGAHRGAAGGRRGHIR